MTGCSADAMILGLQRGNVRVVEHQLGWRTAFADERELLRRRLGPSALLIEHVGSTAVPGLKSKPIIDIAIAVRSLDAAADWPMLLSAELYAFFGDRECRGEHFYAKGPEERRMIYLHVLPETNPRWADYLGFRDLLTCNSEMRREYEDLKVRLSSVYPQDRERYSDEKSAFILKALRPRS